MKRRTPRRRVLAAATVAASVSALIAGCSSSSSAHTTSPTAAGSTAASASSQASSVSSAAGASGKAIHIALITKDPNDPYWFALIKGAQSVASKDNVKITTASGKNQDDAQGQIQAIQDAVARGDDAILIANNGPAVNDAIKKAEQAGLFVVAVDTPTTPTNLVDATYASDNLQAGQLIGQWTAKKLAGKTAHIAMLDLFADKIVGIDTQRDHGFLEGMGIPVGNPNKNGEEPKSGSYSGGGKYQIACHEATNGAEDGGRTAMEKCLTLDPSINVVYTPNEPSALGAEQALKSAGNTKALVVSINGSCDGVKAVASGELGADSQQYPSKMGADGVEAVVNYMRNHVKPTPDAGKDFTNTGIKLVTNDPVSGLSSITAQQGLQDCY